MCAELMLAELTMLLLAGLNSFPGPDIIQYKFYGKSQIFHIPFFEIGKDHQRQSKQLLRTIARVTLKMLATFLDLVIVVCITFATIRGLIIRPYFCFACFESYAQAFYIDSRS